jgi:hypothetical protein
LISKLVKTGARESRLLNRNFRIIQVSAMGIVINIPVMKILLNRLCTFFNTYYHQWMRIMVGVIA